LLSREKRDKEPLFVHFEAQFVEKIRKAYNRHHQAENFKKEQFVNISDAQGKAVAPEATKKGHGGTGFVSPKTYPVKKTDSQISSDYYNNKSAFATAIDLIRGALSN